MSHAEHGEGANFESFPHSASSVAQSTCAGCITAKCSSCWIFCLHPLNHYIHMMIVEAEIVIATILLQNLNCCFWSKNIVIFDFVPPPSPETGHITAWYGKNSSWYDVKLCHWQHTDTIQMQIQLCCLLHEWRKTESWVTLVLWCGVSYCKHFVNILEVNRQLKIIIIIA